ncbi:MerR family transcriptional regulator [Methylibium sp. Pch-M]|uniref:MerR family transcriptional regulator n=1 Tax=Methylibium sp. Pch-M TaxID=2082386 RepID=UPI00101390B6|nr:MerR family transcriptional regulator [Methylibium sp. Pch-M]QAZ41199.1 MerR family transcriptional regulator [Methylibium sp. Pch-M]
MEKSLPPIPAKRYFTIGEVSELCGVKPYVLRYWEQEFSQLKPMKRRGNRRYYQHHEVLLIRRIRELLYEQGFTISGARNRLSEAGVRAALAAEATQVPTQEDGGLPSADDVLPETEAMEAAAVAPTAAVARVRVNAAPPTLATMRDELVSIRQLLLP